MNAKPFRKRPQKTEDSGRYERISIQESAALDAMLSDTDGEMDELTGTSPPRASSTTKSGRRSKRGANPQATAFDEMLVDTDCDQNEITAEIPLGRPIGPIKGRGSKGNGGSTAFDAMMADSDEEEKAYASPAALSRRSNHGEERRVRRNFSQRGLLIAAPFLGCLFFVGLLLYSISGTHTPAPSLTIPSDQQSTSEDNNDASSVLVPGIAPAPEANSASASNKAKNGAPQTADPENAEPVPAAAAPPKARLIAVQMKVDTSMYRDAATFRKAMDRVVGEAAREKAASWPTLVALPEDTGLGLVFLGHWDTVKGAKTLREAGTLLGQALGPQVTAKETQYHVSPVAPSSSPPTTAGSAPSTTRRSALWRRSTVST